MSRFDEYLEAVRSVMESEEISEILSSSIKNIKGVLTYKGKKIRTSGGMEVSAGSREAEKFLNLLGGLSFETKKDKQDKDVKVLTNGKQTYYV
jgi:hypothetical protein